METREKNPFVVAMVATVSIFVAILMGLYAYYAFFLPLVSDASKTGFVPRSKSPWGMIIEYREFRRRQRALSNLRKIGNAMEQYARDNAEQFPRNDDGQEVLEVFECPSSDSQGSEEDAVPNESNTSDTDIPDASDKANDPYDDSDN